MLFGEENHLMLKIKETKEILAMNFDSNWKSEKELKASRILFFK